MKPLNKYIDHTLLRADATSKDIENLCSEAVSYDFYSVCINPCHLPFVCKLLKESSVKIATVCGFPLGSTYTEAKVFEAKLSCENGADEVDMVMNIGKLKEGDFKYVKEDIAAVASEVHSQGKLLKVIIETCLLTDEEKSRATKLVIDGNGDFVKTSTGFSTGGATLDDIKLLKKVAQNKIKIKASGGVRSKKTALAMIDAGADRLGVSASVSIMNE